MRQIATALFAGLTFGAGLVISGMASPTKVLAFLKLGSGWDPSLAIVMAAALFVAIPGFAWLRRLEKPLLAAQFSRPSTEAINLRLVLGAALFGFGWGLAGYCPGPAIVSAALLQKSAFLFVPGMLFGGLLSYRLARPK